MDESKQVLRRQLGNTGIAVSEIGLGGHEFAASSHIKGFHDDLWRSLTPGQVMPGFGGEERLAVLRLALAHGVNFFEVTIDSEKEALGRNLKELGVGKEALVQTRPCGFVYTYDPGNRRFLEADLLLREVERICGLLQRPRIDVLNVGLETLAFEDPAYFDRLGANLRMLKDRGLIRLAACDSFSGGAAYERMIRSGLFNLFYLIYNPLADAAERELFPLAQQMGMGILIKESFLKGQLFQAAQATGLPPCEKARVADIVLRWILRRPEVTTALVGTTNPRHLAANLAASGKPPLTEAELAFVRQLQECEQGRLLRARQLWAWRHGLPPNTPFPADEVVLAEFD